MLCKPSHVIGSLIYVKLALFNMLVYIHCNNEYKAFLHPCLWTSIQSTCILIPFTQPKFRILGNCNLCMCYFSLRIMGIMFCQPLLCLSLTYQVCTTRPWVLRLCELQWLSHPRIYLAPLSTCVSPLQRQYLAHSFRKNIRNSVSVNDVVMKAIKV